MRQMPPSICRTSTRRKRCRWCCHGIRQTCPARKPNTCRPMMRRALTSTFQRHTTDTWSGHGCLHSQHMYPCRSQGTWQRRRLQRKTSICLPHTARKQRTKTRLWMLSICLPHSPCISRCPPLLCTCPLNIPHTYRSLARSLPCTDRRPARIGSRRWLDMSSRPRFQRLPFRCLHRRPNTLLGAPYSLPDTDRSSLLHRRCLQTMSCPLDNSRMLPLTWLQVPSSTC